MASKYVSQHNGFTIVELLIVIVVVAVLVAISVTVFNGAQTRANNSATISAAKSVIGLVLAYRNTYDAYPTTSGTAFCATQDNDCTTNVGTVNAANNATLISELTKVGNPPQSARAIAATSHGIQYIYSNSTNFNGEPFRVRIEYFLQGDGVNCGLQNITNNITNGTTSTTGYSQTGSGRTVCWSMIK